MPREHELGGEVFETGQGRHRLGGIGGEGRHLGAAGAGGDRVGRQRIADDPTLREATWSTALPGLWPGQDDPRSARHVKGRSIAECGDLVQLRNPQPTPPEREPQEPQQRAELDRAVPLGRVGYLAAGQGSVGRMHRHRDVVFATEPLRQADVVGVPMGKEQGADVGDRPPIAASSRGMSR
jgi:hypothetical protein